MSRSTAEEALSYRWVILSVTMTSQASVTVIMQGMAPLAPFFKNAFHLTRGEVGVLTVAVTAGSILAMLAGGWAVDRFGERLILTVTGIGVGLTTLAASLAASYGELVCLLFVAGVWSATAATAGSKAVMGWFPPRHRGLAMSLRQTGVPLGGALAAALLPAVAAGRGWSAALLVAGAGALAAAALLYALYRGYPRAMNEPGASIQRLDLRTLLGNRDIMLTTAVAMCFSCGQWAVIGFMELYSKEALRLPLTAASLLLTVAQLSGACGRVGWGLLSDTLMHGSRVRVLRLSGLAATAAALGTAQLSSGTAPWLIVSTVVLFGVAAIGWNGVFVTLISELAGHARAGAALGLSLTFVFSSITVAPPLFGLLVDRYGSYAPVWRILALVVALGTALTWLIREGNRRS